MSNWIVLLAMAAALVPFVVGRRLDHPGARVGLLLLAMVAYVGAPIYGLSNFKVGGYPAGGTELIVALVALVFYAPLMLAGAIYEVTQGQTMAGVVMGVIAALGLWPWTRVFRSAAGTGTPLQYRDEGATPDDERLDCPYAGKVVVSGETQVMGMPWNTVRTAFQVLPNWTVEDEYGARVGWIDRKGYVHDGAYGPVNPDALSKGQRFAQITTGSCYDLKGKKVGEHWAAGSV